MMTKRGFAVTICSSSKFYDRVEALCKELSDSEVVVYTPRLDFNEQEVEVSREQKHRLTHEFLEKIKKSSCIYVVAGDGYTGRSVCIEVGFATALDLPVYVSEQPQENAIGALTTMVVSLDKAASFLQRQATAAL